MCFWLVLSLFSPHSTLVSISDGVLGLWPADRGRRASAGGWKLLRAPTTFHHFTEKFCLLRLEMDHLLLRQANERALIAGCVAKLRAARSRSMNTDHNKLLHTQHVGLLSFWRTVWVNKNVKLPPVANKLFSWNFFWFHLAANLPIYIFIIISTTQVLPGLFTMKAEHPWHLFCWNFCSSLDAPELRTLLSLKGMFSCRTSFQYTF